MKLKNKIMKVYRKRNEGLEIDYLVFSLFKFRVWITRSTLFSKYPRIVIWKMNKENTAAAKTWQFGA